MSAGLMTTDELLRCKNVSEKLDLTLGKVIVFSGIVEDQLLRGALFIQSLVSENKLEKQTAFEVLKEAARTSRPVEDLLLEYGWSTTEPPGEATSSSARTGDLLVAAGALTKGELSSLLKEASSQNLPLSRVLSQTRKIKDLVIWSTINAQVMLRENKISWEEAVSLVKTAFEQRVPFERTFEEQGLQGSLANRLRLGELLVLSGLINDEDLMTGLETSILEGKTIGQTLVSLNLLTESALKTAFQIQELVDQQKLQPLQAADVLYQVAVLGESFSDAVSRFPNIEPTPQDNIRLGELLHQCGWITQTEVEEAVKISLSKACLLGKLLVLFGYINETTLSNALKCQILIRQGSIKTDQAIVALHYAKDNQQAVDDALVTLGYCEKQGLTD